MQVHTSHRFLIGMERLDSLSFFIVIGKRVCYKFELIVKFFKMLDFSRFTKTTSERNEGDDEQRIHRENLDGGPVAKRDP
jgi:hypothetical protein